MSNRHSSRAAIAVLAVLCAATAPGRAQAPAVFTRVRGAWDCVSYNTSGQTALVLTLSVQHGRLVGGMQEPPRGTTPIENAALRGDTLSFALLGGMINYRLHVSGDSLHGYWLVSAPGNPADGDRGVFRAARRPGQRRAP